MHSLCVMITAAENEVRDAAPTRKQFDEAVGQMPTHITRRRGKGKPSDIMDASCIKVSGQVLVGYVDPKQKVFQVVAHALDQEHAKELSDTMIAPNGDAYVPMHYTAITKCRYGLQDVSSVKWRSGMGYPYNDQDCCWWPIVEGTMYCSQHSDVNAEDAVDAKGAEDADI